MIATLSVMLFSSLTSAKVDVGYSYEAKEFKTLAVTEGQTIALNVFSYNINEYFIHIEPRASLVGNFKLLNRETKILKKDAGFTARYKDRPAWRS